MTCANTTSLRLQILQAMAASFSAIEADKPDADPYGIDFSKVSLGPIDDGSHRKRFSIGIVAGPERFDFIYPFQVCFLTVNVEFRATINRGDDSPAEMIEQVLTVVKRRLVEDRTWGGLAVDTLLKAADIDIVTDDDRSALGVCVCEVQYRHANKDPRDPLPAFD